MSSLMFCFVYAPPYATSKEEILDKPPRGAFAQPWDAVIHSFILKDGVAFMRREVFDPWALADYQILPLTEVNEWMQVKLIARKMNEEKS